MTAGDEHPGNGRRGLYRPAPWLVLRTPLLSVDGLQLARKPRRALEKPDVVRALAIGCPDLLATLQRPTTKGRDKVRAENSLARYLIRMSTRPTPYGAFAGVSLAAWGAETTLALGPGQRLRTRPDMGWGVSLLRAAEADPEVRESASWRANPMLQENDGRLGSGAGTVSVKATRPARLALQLAERPIAYADLRAGLLEQTSGTAFQIETMLAELWQHGLLLTDLNPRITGTTATDGTELADRLRAARPETATAVDGVLGLMRDFDRAPADEAPARLAAIGEAARAIAPSEQPVFQTDLARELTGDRLHESVAAECARAAELLLRLNPAPTAPPDLIAYQRRFEARYGLDREVPLLELFDPAVGLGPMPHTHGGDAGIDPQRAARRADALLALALKALRDRRRTVELDAATVQALQTWSPATASAPLSVELAVFVVGTDPAAIDRGEFSVVVGPNLGATSAGRWLGRFADLLAPASDDAYAWLLDAESAARPGPVPAEVVYLPANPRTTNVVIRPVMAPHEIVVDGRPGAESAIELDDLVVGTRRGQLYIRSLRLGREVRPTARHMLNHHGAPPVCQFLDEVAQGMGPRISGFSWGQAESLPFLPRVCSGRVVLEPARWRLPVRTTSGGQVIDLADFRADLAEWRGRWDVPSRVYVSTADNRLLLDLDDAADVEQLHREARQSRPGGDLRLHEALPDVADAWLPGPGGRYLSEIVVPLVLRPASVVPAAEVPSGSPATPAPGGAPVLRRRPPPEIGARVRPPGSDWLFAKFYLPPDRMSDLLIGPVLDLCSVAENSGLARRWFFIRYADPEPHLRVRWQGEPDLLLHQLLPQVTAFSQQLIEAGQIRALMIDTYERELDRYGGEEGTDVSERIFHADSATVQQLLDLPPGVVDRTDLAALTMHTLLTDLGMDAEARLALYRRQASGSDEALGRTAGEEYRRRKSGLRRALGPDGAAELDTSGRVRAVLDRQRGPLAQAGAELGRLADGGGLTCGLDDLWPSYLHMHHNRLVGASGIPGEALLLHLLRRTQEGLLLSGRR